MEWLPQQLYNSTTTLTPESPKGEGWMALRPISAPLASSQGPAHCWAHRRPSVKTSWGCLWNTYWKNTRTSTSTTHPFVFWGFPNTCYQEVHRNLNYAWKVSRKVLVLTFAYIHKHFLGTALDQVQMCPHSWQKVTSLNRQIQDGGRSTSGGREHSGGTLVHKGGWEGLIPGPRLLELNFILKIKSINVYAL